MVHQIKALHAGVDVVIATPGRLNDLLERKEMSVADVTMVVLDEADQMADMGFLPQVRQILDQIDGEHQTLLFSATLDGSIGELVKQVLSDLGGKVEVGEMTVREETRGLLLPTAIFARWSRS